MYWTESGSSAVQFVDGKVHSAALNGSDVLLLAIDQHDPQRITVDDDNVYWTNRGFDRREGSIALCKRGVSCGARPTRIAFGQDRPSAIAVDATNVYWSNEGSGTGDGTIMKCPKPLCSGGPVVLARNVNAYAIAVDEGAVYWADHRINGGSIGKVAK